MTDNDPACHDCNRLFSLETRELVKGQEHVYIVSPGPLLCRRCKEEVVAALERG